MVKLDLDLDLHSEKLLDPYPQKMNADPQPCYRLWDSGLIVISSPLLEIIFFPLTCNCKSVKIKHIFDYFFLVLNKLYLIFFPFLPALSRGGGDVK